MHKYVVIIFAFSKQTSYLINSWSIHSNHIKEGGKHKTHTNKTTRLTEIGYGAGGFF